MKRETDMEQVRLTAKMLLMTDVHETEYSPMVVQHPFTSSGIVMLPGKNAKDFGMIDITQNRENMQAWQTAVSLAIDNAGNPYQIYMMINKPYGLTFSSMQSRICHRMIFLKSSQVHGLCVRLPITIPM